MKIIIQKLILLLAIAITSCNNAKKTTIETEKETPKALQDSRLSSYSEIRSNEDLVENLYAEFSDNNPELKKLNTDITEILKQPEELTNTIRKYKDKSDNFYASADSKARGINDSVLKLKVSELINKSNLAFTNKLNDHNSLLKLISKKEVTLTDRYTILKIVYTLPLIEKYQTQNLPNKKDLEIVVEKQNTLIRKIDSLLKNKF